jgi:DNA uptake protein ComE-like DNA-binding protein
MVKRKLQTKPFMFFTRRQRMGLFYLLGIILLFTTLFLALSLFIQPELNPDQKFEDEIRAHADAAEPEANVNRFNYFPFDPNVISTTQMLDLGLTSRQAEMIAKYREAGGHFFDKVDFGKIYAISNQDYELLEPYIIISEKTRGASEKPEVAQKSIFPFDPNRADSAELQSLGLNSYQTANVLKYRKAGGVFTTKKDLSKIYGMDAKTYQKLEKYILLPSSASMPSTAANVAIHPELIEINIADTNELRKLKGIGKVYAQRIANYRDKLGGFFDKSQLLEVHGIDTSRFAMFAPQVVVDRSLIHRININEATFDDLFQHPYLEFYIVKEIFNYRDAIGAFDSVAQLKSVNLIYDQLYYKIEPYLTVTKRKELP